MNQSSVFQHKANRALQGLWGFWLLNLGLLAGSQLSASSESHYSASFIFAGIFLWAAKSLPLLAAFIPLKKRSHRAATWLAYSCLFYFLIWVLVCFTPGRMALGLSGLFSSTGLFIACLLFTRFEKRAY